MLFSAPIFLFLFLPLVLFFYFTIGRRFPNFVLIIASLIFYFWGEPSFILILILAVTVNYFFGIKIQNNLNNKSSARKLLSLAIVTNLGLLIYYKYWIFLTENFTQLTAYIPKISIPQIAIPLGISFFAFHAISYNIDIFRKKAKAQKNIFQLLLYFLLFPHLLAGPIVRYSSIVGQLKKRVVSFNDFAIGVQIFVIGLSKKVLIADKLSPVVNEIFSMPVEHMGIQVAWIGIICFALQIYFDFSGYSDMAIGLARMFGFTFPQNFNYPYIASSITDFWRRWHITLSSWFRDYVYIPLGGSRVGVFKRYFNLWTVFILVGIWHGASWNFIVWGIVQAIFLSIERFHDGILFKNLWTPFKHIYALLAIIIGWVFFRTENLTDAIKYLQLLFGFGNDEIVFQSAQYFLQRDIIIVIIAGVILSLPIAEYFKQNKFLNNTRLNILKIIGFTVFFILISVSVASQTYNPFLYFRF